MRHCERSDAIFAHTKDCVVAYGSCSETKSLLRTSHSWQPVIPGEQRETRNPGAKDWIPASAGMTNREKPTVSVVALSAPRYGGLRMTRLKGHRVKWTNVMHFGLEDPIRS